MNKIMRKLIINSDGGLFNRMGSIIGGLVTAEELGISSIEILWPLTQYCDCKFEKLFDTNFNVIYDKNKVFNDSSKFIFLTHYRWKNSNFSHVFDQNLESIKIIKSMKQNILYNHNYLPEYFNDDQVIKKLKSIKINENILKTAYNFYKSKNMDKSVIGIHLRRTDSNYSEEDTKMKLDFVKKNQDKRFFICSDDPNAENLFKEYKNVIIFPKTKYVEKIEKDKDWYGFKDRSRNNNYYNIFRSEESVIQGCIDLLILSQTNLEFLESISETRRPGSTYLLFAFLYNNIDVFKI